MQKNLPPCGVLFALELGGTLLIDRGVACLKVSTGLPKSTKFWVGVDGVPNGRGNAGALKESNWKLDPCSNRDESKIVACTSEANALPLLWLRNTLFAWSAWE